MDTIIVILCCIIILFLIVIIISSGRTKFSRKDLDILFDKQSRDIKDSVKDNMTYINSRVDANQKVNQENYDNIRSIVTDKMQGVLTDRISALNIEMSHKFNDLGIKLSDEQIKQMNIINENMEKLRAENKESLDKINGTVNEKLQDALDKKINESFRTINEQLLTVSKELYDMQRISTDVSNLNKILGSVKTRGNFGEVQLDNILSDSLTVNQYETQMKIKDNSLDHVDFAVKLPGKESDIVYLPIDSKFPGDTYVKYVDAINANDKDAIESTKKALINTVKAEAKSIKEKYIYPPKTTDFAIMFLSSEGLYSEVIKFDMLDVLQRDYHVIIAGPSTMMALLNSFRMGFQTLQIQKKSVEIQKVLENTKKEFENFSDALSKTKKHLGQIDKDLDDLIGTRTNAINRALSNIVLDTNDD